MGRKKRKGNKKRKGSSALSKEQEELISALLERLSRSAAPSDIAGEVPDAQIAESLLERVPLDKEILVSLIPALSEKFQDKGVQKAVKRVLHRLKSKGVSLDPFVRDQEDSGPVLKSLPLEEPRVLIGPVLDLYGSQGIFFVIDRRGPGKYGAVGIVSNETGIQEFLFTVYGKKDLRKMEQDFSQAAGPLVETVPSHAASIVESAYNCHQEGGTEVPRDFLEFHPVLLKTVPSPDRSVVHEVLPEVPDSAEPGPTLSQLSRLFEDPFMGSWIIDYESIKPFIDKIDKAQDSPLVLSDSQREERFTTIKNRCIEELFPSSKRALMKYRLEDMAYFFSKSGDEESCRLAALSAQSLEKEDNLLVKNPVIDFLVDRSLRFYLEGGMQGGEEEAEGQEDSSGLILS